MTSGVHGCKVYSLQLKNREVGRKEELRSNNGRVDQVVKHGQLELQREVSTIGCIGEQQILVKAR